LNAETRHFESKEEVRKELFTRERSKHSGKSTAGWLPGQIQGLPHKERLVLEGEDEGRAETKQKGGKEI